MRIVRSTIMAPLLVTLATGSVTVLGVLPAPVPAQAVRLSYWRFNTPDWLGENGEAPLEALNVTHVPSFDGNALSVNATNTHALLRYRVVESSGKTNLDVRCGTIRFMYKPNWTSTNFSGRGPRQTVRLWELGNPDQPGGGMALSIDADGRHLNFATEDDSGRPAVRLTGLYDGFSTYNWYEFVLTFSTVPFSPANRVRLWINTTPAIMEDNVLYFPLPPAGVQAKGFTMGSSADGIHQGEGIFDEWEIFNYELGAVGAQMISGQMSAEVRAQPPAITLRWRRVPSVPAKLQRKSPSASTWTTLTETLAWSYTDADPALSVGQRYQYQLLLGNTPLVEDSLTTGLNLPAADNRGSVVLLVDKTVASALSGSLQQLQQDLVGDGWTVLRHDVPRHDDHAWDRRAVNKTYIQDVANIKSLITADYCTAASPVKAVFIVGHVTIPYSGAAAEDGHVSTPEDPLNHLGAWPADAYYGDMGGNWPDQSVNCVNKINHVLQNLPGDGKFDPNVFPGKLAVAVGRIDFARMPVFATQPPQRNETDLLKQYLDKDHRYRQGQSRLPNRLLVIGYFPASVGSLNTALYDNAVRNSCGWFGLAPGVVMPGDPFIDPRPALWGIEGGFGINNALNAGGAAEHSARDLADPAREPAIGYYLLKGSLFCDWNGADNNLLKATLATPNYGLASMFTMSLIWRFGSLGLGDTLGDGFLATVNETVPPPSCRTTFLLGDPTLRLGLVAPVSNLSATANGVGGVRLDWQASPDSETAYFVYRSSKSQTASASDFSKLTPAPLSGTSFTDNAPPAGAKLYEVRALKAAVTGSGCYTNLSQGVFVAVAAGQR